MWTRRLIAGMALIGLGFCAGQLIAQTDANVWDGTLVQYGKMHEAIGQQQHQGRVQFKDLLERPHFFGVAALEGLAGEATVFDGQLTITRVGEDGQLDTSPVVTGNESATLLVGAYVPAWTERRISAQVTDDAFDEQIAQLAVQAGIEVAKPFVFTVEGEFEQLRMHVIHGACPMHARLRKIELPKEKQPFEMELENVRGTVVGVFAKNAVGDITHPATSTHMHFLWKDEGSGHLVTGHIEHIEVSPGAVLRLPKQK
jgi:alpha-acetolactate decarboxylase